MKQDLVQRIYAAQAAIREKYNQEWRGTETIQEYVNYLGDEVHELRHSLYPRFWKTRQYAYSEFLDEAADVFITLINVMYVAGVPESDFWQAVERKMAYNKVRTDRDE
jgi:NTP pyrophosphatase (non-canonical NTP hydrolase)